MRENGTMQSPGRMKNSSYYIGPVGVRTHDLPQTVASNMVKVSHSDTAAPPGYPPGGATGTVVHRLDGFCPSYDNPLSRALRGPD